MTALILLVGLAVTVGCLTLLWRDWRWARTERCLTAAAVAHHERLMAALAAAREESRHAQP